MDLSTWEFEASFGGQMPFLAPAYYELGKRRKNQMTQ